MESPKQCGEYPDCVKRITKLETYIELQFKNMDKALTLARENLVTAQQEERQRLAEHLHNINQFQKRMDKLEGTFATKEQLNEKLEPIRKLVYIGLGGLLAIQVLLRWIRI